MKFYKNEEKRVPVEEFLDSLPTTDACRVLWMLRMIEESDWLPEQYAFSHGDPEGLWEFRISAKDRNYWILAFQADGNWVLFNADLSMRFQKAPEKEVRRAAGKMEDYSSAFRLLPVGDLKKYMTLRKKRDKEFAEKLETGYPKFRLGTTMRQIREKSGLNQKLAADKLNIAASKVSKIENHAEEMELKSLEDYLEKLREILQA